jgi:hypothetical protein
MTAIQKVFSDLEKLQPHLFDIHTQVGREFINHFHQYLELEKQQIIDACENTILSVELSTDKKGFFAKEGEGYYKETFEKHETND